MITLDLTFKNAISGKSRRFSIPNPVANLSTLTVQLDTHLTTYVEPILPDNLLFAIARVVDNEVTDILVK